MDFFHSVVGGTIALALICVVLSTWTTVSELASFVTEEDHNDVPVDLESIDGWGGLAHRAIEHIEHLPHGDHGSSAVRILSQKKQQISTTAGICFVLPKTDYYGEAVRPGPFNIQPSAAACCQSCLSYEPPSNVDSPCNVWVWCGDKARCGASFQHCWLKHLPWVYASKPLTGDEVPWTSGLLEPPIGLVSDDPKAFGGHERRFHTVTSAQGTATHWQMRIHYYWFKKQQQECRRRFGDHCHMGGFTRLLHSGYSDELAGEIPTFVANPLPSDAKGYVVLNRPYAFLQWVNQVQLEESFVLMSEPDHIFLRPIQNLMKGNNPASFPFFYIEPSRKDYVHITQKFIGFDKTRKDCEKIAPIGSSPTMMRFDDLRTIAGSWVNTSIAIFNDKEANKEWGWVMEMYAFTIALYNHGVGPVGLHLELASQPPWDTTMDYRGLPYYILHYTYGVDYTLDGVFTPGKFGAWRFDKRTYAYKPPPRNLGKPPDGMKNDLVRFLINAINEATNAIPGWDEYYLTGRANQLMMYKD